MKCPYLSSGSKKECVKMLSHDLVDELTDFDMEHFCDGDPIYCYYFRLPPTQMPKQTIKSLKETAYQSNLNQPATTGDMISSLDDILRHINYRDSVRARANF